MPGSFLSLFLPDQSQSSRQKILRIFLNEIQDFLNDYNVILNLKNRFNTAPYKSPGSPPPTARHNYWPKDVAESATHCW